jgi:predicted DNA-binding protein
MDSLERPTSLVFRVRRSRLDALKALSRETRILQSKYLREAIADLLEKYEHCLAQ